MDDALDRFDNGAENRWESSINLLMRVTRGGPRGRFHRKSAQEKTPQWKVRDGKKAEVAVPFMRINSCARDGGGGDGGGTSRRVPCMRG